MMSRKICLIVVFLGWGLLGLSHAEFPKKPEDLALNWLENLSHGHVAPHKLLEETAVSPLCSKSKKSSLESRVVRWQKELRAVKGDWQVYKARQMGRHAGVIVHSEAERWRDGFGVFSIALVSDDVAWKVAPTPGSFEATELNYSLKREKVVQELESWMARESALLRQELFVKAQKDLIERSNIPAWNEKRYKGNVKEMITRFLEACEQGEVEVILGDIGVAEGHQEREEWLQRLVKETFESSVKEMRGSYWYFLREGRKTVKWFLSDVGHGGGHVVQMLAFNPLKPDTFEYLVFDLRRFSERWEVGFPPENWAVNKVMWQENAGFVDDDFEEEVLALKFFHQREESFASSARQLAELLEKDFREYDFAKVMTRVEMVRDEDAAKRVFRNASSLFKKLGLGKESQVQDVKLLDVLEENKSALAIYSLLNLEEKLRVTLVPVLLLKKDQTWQVLEGVMSVEDAEEGRSAFGGLLEKYQKKRESYEQKAQSLSKFGVPTLILDRLKLPNKKKVQDTLENYLKNLTNTNSQLVFQDIAALSKERSQDLIVENVYYARKGSQGGEILAFHEASPWVGVSLKTTIKQIFLDIITAWAESHFSVN